MFIQNMWKVKNRDFEAKPASAKVMHHLKHCKMKNVNIIMWLFMYLLVMNSDVYLK